MSAVKRIGIFVAGLAVVLGVALAIGSAVEPSESDEEPRHGGHAVEMEGVVRTAQFTVVVSR